MMLLPVAALDSLKNILFLTVLQPTGSIQHPRNNEDRDRRTPHTHKDLIFLCVVDYLTGGNGGSASMSKQNKNK